jgi:hypothetical protein
MLWMHTQALKYAEVAYSGEGFHTPPFALNPETTLKSQRCTCVVAALTAQCEFS